MLALYQNKYSTEKVIPTMKSNWLQPVVSDAVGHFLVNRFDLKVELVGQREMRVFLATEFLKMLWPSIWFLVISSTQCSVLVRLWTQHMIQKLHQGRRHLWIHKYTLSHHLMPIQCFHNQVDLQNSVIFRHLIHRGAIHLHISISRIAAYDHFMF